MREMFQIARGDRGIRQTLRAIIDLAAVAPTVPWWRTLALCYPPRQLDGYLRARWRYVPDIQDGQPAETLRTLQRLQKDIVETGQFHGDCDDAAIVAAALVILNRPVLKMASLVAVRPPMAADFTTGHVFTVAADDRGMFRIDPTAPVDADYTQWEQMPMILF